MLTCLVQCEGLFYERLFDGFPDVREAHSLSGAHPEHVAAAPTCKVLHLWTLPEVWAIGPDATPHPYLLDGHWERSVDLELGGRHVLGTIPLPWQTI